eukprot:4078177-Pleurochrysis_carterae.AAC.2
MDRERGDGWTEKEAMDGQRKRRWMDRERERRRVEREHERLGSACLTPELLRPFGAARVRRQRTSREGDKQPKTHLVA